MKPANDAARKLPFVQRVGFNAVAAAGLACATGCATTGDAWHTGARAMTSLLWPRDVAEPRGDDPYAREMANSKAVLAARGADSTATSPASGPTPKAAPADAERKSADASQPPPATGRRTADPSLRVTLGRPESVPVLNEYDGEPGPLLASAEPAPAPEPAPPPRRAPEIDAPADAEAQAPRPRRSPQAVKLAATPAAAEPRKSAEATLAELLDDARGRLEAMNTYQVAITRIERVRGNELPEEKALLSIRRDPKAVRLEWPDGPSKGREVIYSAAINDKVMQVNVANSALIPRMTIPIDSVLAMRNSRHPINEAGFDTIFDDLKKQFDAQGRPTGGEGRLTYKGLQPADGVDRPCHLIQRITPTKEVWRVYLDPDSLMPVVVTAQEADGTLLESYRYENLKPNPPDLAAAEAFDPDKRWGESKGLFSRLARGGSGSGSGSDAPAAATTR